jgi:hypothetical protein
VTERLKAPRVAPLGIEFGLKYHDPYTPEMVVWIVFLSHLLLLVIEYVQL